MPSPEDRILQAVDGLFEEQVEFLAKLVAYRTLRENEAEAQGFLEASLVKRGYKVRRLQTDATQIGKHPAFSPSAIDYRSSWNVVGLRPAKQRGGRSLAFNSQIDVVPAANEARWSSPPFKARKNGDWLYGRGAGDMKAGLSASLYALEAIAHAGLTLRGDVQIQSVVEEEITGNGAATAFVNGFIADAIVSAEPTDEQLVRANSGVLKFRLTTRGRPAHPREPEAGQSAIDLMIKLISHLRALERKWIGEAKGKRGFDGIANPVALTFGTIAGGD